MEELLPGSLEIKRVKKVREEEIKRAAVAKEVAVGGRYKNFEALTPAGERVQLQEYIKNNNYTLLEVWASWCNPCIKTIKQLPPIYATHKQGGFEIVAISIDTSKNKWERAIKELNMPWPSLFNIDEPQNDVGELYAISAIPKNILFDRQGTIVAVDLTPQQLESFLNSR